MKLLPFRHNIRLGRKGGLFYESELLKRAARLLHGGANICKQAIESERMQERQVCRDQRLKIGGARGKAQRLGPALAPLGRGTFWRDTPLPEKGVCTSIKFEVTIPVERSRRIAHCYYTNTLVAPREISQASSVKRTRRI